MSLNLIYAALVDRLMTGDPLGLALVDWYTGQERTADNAHPLHCPAVLVEFLPVTWQTMTGRIQQGTLDMRLHLIQDRYQDKRSDTTGLTTALSHLTLADSLYARLEGWLVDNAQGNRLLNSLRRIASETDHAPGPRFVSRATYRSLVYDYGAEVTYDRRDDLENGVAAQYE